MTQEIALDVLPKDTFPNMERINCKCVNMTFLPFIY